jgi:hypothetical protein
MPSASSGYCSVSFISEQTMKHSGNSRRRKITIGSTEPGPPLWSSGQEFLATDPEARVVGLERGPLSLVSTTEELLHIKVAALV